MNASAVGLRAERTPDDDALVLTAALRLASDVRDREMTAAPAGAMLPMLGAVERNAGRVAKLLEHEEADVREAGLSLLIKLELEVISPFVRMITPLLEDPTPRVRRAALYALADIGGTVVEKLLPVLANRALKEDEDASVRAAAEYVLTILDAAGPTSPRHTRRAGWVNAMTGIEDRHALPPESDDSDWDED